MAKVSGFVPGLIVGAAVGAAVVIGINALRRTCDNNHYVVVDSISTPRLPETCSHTTPITWRASDNAALGITIPDWSGDPPTTTTNPYPAASCTGNTCDSGPFNGSAIQDGTLVKYSITFKATGKKIFGHIVIVRP